MVQLPDGRLRMYTQCYGVRLSVAEADSVRGPWVFIKNEAGEIRNVVSGLPGGSWLFPSLQHIKDHGYILTGGNAWPPKEGLGSGQYGWYQFSVPGN